MPGIITSAVALLSLACGAPSGSATAARRQVAEQVAATLTGRSLAHARHTPPPRPAFRSPTPRCPPELARQVNATGLLPVDMFGDAATDDAERVRMAINASRVCGGAIFFDSTPGHIAYVFGSTVDVPANIIFQGGGWSGVAEFQTPAMAEIGGVSPAFSCVGAQVRKTPSWPRSWANFSPL